MDYNIEFPEFDSEWEQNRFITWSRGHMLFKDYLSSVENLSIRGIIKRNQLTSDVKFILQLEYTSINTLDDVEQVLETIEQR